MKDVEMLFTLLFTASLYSAVILLLVLLIRRLFHKRLNPRVVYMLWFLVLIKLLVPVAPQSPISLFNVLPKALPVEWNLDERILPPPSSTESHSTAGLSPNHSKDSSIAPQPSLNQTGKSAAAATPMKHPQSYALEMEDELSWRTAGSLVWLGGLLCFSSYYLFSTLVFKSRIRNSLKVDDKEILSVVAACQEKLGITRPIPVYETNGLHSPCLYGLWKPGIYLPEDIIAIANTNQLTHILMHELTHYKRKDLWCNALWMLSAGVHWYNPLVWLAMKKMKADQETACDASVLERLGEREASSYGMTLLMLSRLFSRNASAQVNLSHFGGSKKETKRRMLMITKFKKGSYKLSLAAILLVLVLGAVLLTDALDDGKGLDTSIKAEDGERDFSPIYNDSFRWFHKLERGA
ncbi:M56 family metallopeptidase [Paenibacillus senegalensis]|uniref:M56 family metallopeptidase n=1 Tax=Paenibacillus senegalensis TaxID=1465766 RepID=UPI0003153835|nr:M56 family metallopeptidase [Paenibacillus senegalensis]